jgi:flagellar motor switch protein FliN/FliY
VAGSQPAAWSQPVAQFQAQPVAGPWGQQPVPGAAGAWSQPQQPAAWASQPPGPEGQPWASSAAAQAQWQQPLPYPQNMMAQPGVFAPPVTVRKAQFPDFSEQGKKGQPSSGNIGLLMGVPLEVSIVIGKTKRKIKDILEFGQGTVLELEKQTGAPAEIIVNGQLLAYGDVIVIGDNFGVRITEIVGTKELMESLDGGF